MVSPWDIAVAPMINMPAQKAAKMMQKRTSVHLRFSMSCGDETREERGQDRG